MPPRAAQLGLLHGDDAATPGAPARTACVAGLGRALPAQRMPNARIAARLGVDDAWIVRRTGVRSRRHAEPGERTADLATTAASRALIDAGIDAGAVDLVLVATMTADEVMPNAAPLVAHALGATRAAAMDIGAACTGWLSALSLATGQIESGRAEVAVVVGAEIVSRLLDPDDRKTAALFGDGAGAITLSRTGTGAVGSIELSTDGALAPYIVAGRDDPRIRMDGQATFSAAVTRMAQATSAACARARRTLDEIDLFVYHQANGRILDAVAARLGLAPERVANYIADTGNTSAASIPLALSFARDAGRLRRGHRVLVAAVGAGFTWGAGVIDW